MSEISKDTLEQIKNYIKIKAKDLSCEYRVFVDIDIKRDTVKITIYFKSPKDDEKYIWTEIPSRDVCPHKKEFKDRILAPRASLLVSKISEMLKETA